MYTASKGIDDGIAVPESCILPCYSRTRAPLTPPTKLYKDNREEVRGWILQSTSTHFWYRNNGRTAVTIPCDACAKSSVNIRRLKHPDLTLALLRASSSPSPSSHEVFVRKTSLRVSEWKAWQPKCIDSLEQKNFTVRDYLCRCPLPIFLGGKNTHNTLQAIL